MADKDDGLVDMKMTAAQRTGGLNSIAYKPPEYSYGLVLRLEKADLEKLGIKRLPEVGADYELTAVCKVTRVHEAHGEGEEADRAVQLQICKMKLK